MELVLGVTLAQRIERGPMTPRDAARVCSVAASALAAARAAGIVHRDIKPSNLMACEEEPGIRVFDFGISKALKEEGSARDGATQAHQFMGTPGYMAPEQLRSAADVTGAADVYSLGRTLQELLRRASPIGTRADEPRATETGEQQLRDLQEEMPDVPADLLELLSQCLSPSPSLRPSASEMGERLSRIADQLEAPPAVDVARAAIAAVHLFHSSVTVAPPIHFPKSVVEAMETPTAASENADPRRPV